MDLTAPCPLAGVLATRLRAELCLTNLVSNAIKYAVPGDSESWIVVRGRVDAASDERPAEVVVEVADNGVGVPPDQRERLFERFFRGGATSTGVEGTGLGLSIIRETVIALGGRTWADFPPEGGGIFAFSLPLRRAGERGGLTPRAGMPALTS